MELGVVLAWLVYLCLLALVQLLAARQDGHISGDHLVMVGSLALLAVAGAWRASITSLSPWLVPLTASAVVLLLLAWSRGKPASFYRRRIEALESRPTDDVSEQ